MNQLIYLLLLFCLLFLIESKAINILLSFVAIMISLAFILPTLTTEVGSIESEYYSYILILVQVSALTILFGFIIMLFPNLSHSTPQTNYGNSLNIKELSLNSREFLLTNKSVRVNSNPTNRVGGSKSIIGTIGKYIFIGGVLSIIIYYIRFFDLNATLQLITYQHHYNTVQDILNNTETSDTLFLRKIGIFLYSIDHNIIKLIVLTIILLLAIVSLFFLIA